MSDGNSKNQPFGFGVRIGIVLISEAFAVSLFACIGFLIYIAYSSATIPAGAKRYWSTATHVHYYFMSLMVSEIIQAIGGVMSVKWVIESDVSSGVFCQMQGALKQIGDVGNALASLAIAINTFAIIVFKWTPPESPKLAIGVLTGIWTFLLVIVITNATIHKQNFYADTEYWCWISDLYPVQRIALEYFWMWFAALLNIILYALIALVIEGIIVFSGWKIIMPAKAERVHMRLRGGKPSNVLAGQMLFYPAVYTFTVLPIAIARWISFVKGNKAVPFEATVVAAIFFASSGLFNVVLFALTRPTLVPVRRQAHTRNVSVMPFGTDPIIIGVGREGRLGRTDTLDPNEEWAVAPRVSPVDKIPPHPVFPPPTPTSVRNSYGRDRNSYSSYTLTATHSNSNSNYNGPLSDVYTLQPNRGMSR